MRSLINIVPFSKDKNVEEVIEDICKELLDIKIESEKVGDIGVKIKIPYVKGKHQLDKIFIVGFNLYKKRANSMKVDMNKSIINKDGIGSKIILLDEEEGLEETICLTIEFIRKYIVDKLDSNINLLNECLLDREKTVRMFTYIRNSLDLRLQTINKRYANYIEYETMKNQGFTNIISIDDEIALEGVQEHLIYDFIGDDEVFYSQYNSIKYDDCYVDEMIKGSSIDFDMLLNVLTNTQVRFLMHYLYDTDMYRKRSRQSNFKIMKAIRKRIVDNNISPTDILKNRI